MKTERAREMLFTEFKDSVNHEPGNGLDAVLEYQDIMGTSSMRGIREFENTLEKGYEKRHFVWVNMLTLSEESAMNILKGTVILREREMIYDQFDRDCQERETALFKSNNIFTDCKKAIYRKIRSLTNKILELQWKADYWKERAETAEYSVNKLQRINYRNAQDAEKYHAIKELLG